MCHCHYRLAQHGQRLTWMSQTSYVQSPANTVEIEIGYVRRNGNSFGGRGSCNVVVVYCCCGPHLNDVADLINAATVTNTDAGFDMP